MSDFDDELEDDDLEDSAAPDEETDDFEDPQQTTAALTREISKLRQKNEVLRQFNVRQKDKYKDEVRSFLTPLIQKYKDIQSENEFLKRQIKEISQNNSLVRTKAIGENGGNGHSHHNDDLVQVMENTIEEKEREISVLNKMVRTLEEESFSLKKDIAELPELREALKAKSEKLSSVEEEKYDIASKIEAKDILVEKYLKQINDLETNVYVLNKRISERAGHIENGKVSEYEEKLREANQKIDKLNDKITNLEKQLSDYQDTMSSLEEELDEDTFLHKSDDSMDLGAVAAATAFASETLAEDNNVEEHHEISEEDVDMSGHEPESIDEFVEDVEAYDYSKLYSEEDNSENQEVEDYSTEDLPSDDDLLADDIELEGLSDEDIEASENLVDSLLNDDDDIDLEIADLPVEDYDEESLEDMYANEELDDSDLSLDDLPIDSETSSINFEKEDEDNADDGFNPLDEFDTSDDIFDEDRDTATKKS